MVHGYSRRRVSLPLPSSNTKLGRDPQAWRMQGNLAKVSQQSMLNLGKELLNRKQHDPQTWACQMRWPTMSREGPSCSSLSCCFHCHSSTSSQGFAAHKGLKFQTTHSFQGKSLNLTLVPSPSHMQWASS